MATELAISEFVLSQGRALRITSFTAASRLYRQYLDLRREVFVGEMGWTFLSDGPYADASDEHSIFILGESDRSLVGCGRATVGIHSLPHEEAFKEHLLPGRLDCPRAGIAEINAVAVVKSFRAVSVRLAGEEFTCGQAIVATLLQVLQQSGVVLAMLSTQRPKPERFFSALGFVPIDSPYSLPPFPCALVNMACVLPLAARLPLLSAFLVDDGAEKCRHLAEYVARRSHGGSCGVL